MAKPIITADEFEQEALNHLSTLLSVAMRFTRNSTDAEDLVQDTLVKAMRARHQFHAGTNMRAWLIKILTNTFINRFRRGGLEKSVLEGPDADPLADGVDAAAAGTERPGPDAGAGETTGVRERNEGTGHRGQGMKKRITTEHTEYMERKQEPDPRF